MKNIDKREQWAKNTADPGQRATRLMETAQDIITDLFVRFHRETDTETGRGLVRAIGLMDEAFFDLEEAGVQR